MLHLYTLIFRSLFVSVHFPLRVKTFTPQYYVFVSLTFHFLSNKSATQKGISLFLFFSQNSMFYLQYILRRPFFFSSSRIWRTIDECFITLSYRGIRLSLHGRGMGVRQNEYLVAGKNPASVHMALRRSWIEPWRRAHVHLRKLLPFLLFVIESRWSSNRVRIQARRH